MKELIDKLSLGVIEYTKPVIEVSADEIILNIEAERVYEGSFKIISANEMPLKGIIYSTDNRLSIINGQFIGTDNTIRYKVDTKYSDISEEIKGNINIISNGGELSIPFTVSVVATGADTTQGIIKNLFHFANLVQTSYDEAVKLFKSPSFSHIFLENNLPLMAVYNGLIGSTDVNTAMEEFLIAANKKKAVSISVSKEGEEYRNINEDYGDVITISKDTWGYVNIAVDVVGDFIGVDRKNVTGSEFAGNKYEFSYYIKQKKLHVGKNQGKIIFSTLGKSICFNVSVYIDKNRERRERSREIKSLLKEILNKYLDFRMHKIDVNQWVEASNDLITRARGIEDSIFLKLLQAHVYITRGNENDGTWLLENIAEDILPVRDSNVELYCYYLYVRTIQKRDVLFTKEAIEKIRQYYENGYDSWKILWVLLFVDEVYDNNITIKLIRIKDKYISGMRSPLLYFEALSCFNEIPELLRVMDDFEIQVLNFGIKRDFINKKLALRINDIARTERKFNPIVFNIMTSLYEKYCDDSILESICIMLIKCTRTDGKYFKWFSKCVDKEMKITSLYEYYMYTINDEFTDVIPQIVMMYFIYNSKSLPDEKEDLLYANIIKNKNRIPVIYNLYKAQIEKYGAHNVAAGRINRNLAVIYKDIFTKAMIGSELADRLGDILSTYEICCDADDIREIVIVHKEINELRKYKLKNGKAYAQIYTEDAAVIFEDIWGNRHYQSVEYEKHKLFDMEEYLKMCYEMSQDNRNLVLYFGDRYLKYRKNAGKSIEILKALANINELVIPFKLMIEKKIADYYSINYDGDSLDEYLENVDADNLGTAVRVKIMEMAVIRGLYDRAYELISKYGFYNMEPRRILKCAAKFIDTGELEEDALVVDMAAFAFERGKYNEQSLIYLGKYFNGTTKQLLKIWKAAKDFECESRDLEEKIIVQVLFSGAYVGRTDDIYASYCMKGAKEKVKKAYLFSKSYDYFARERIVEESIFKYIEKDLYNGDEVNDMCGLAYLKYMSEREEISSKEAEICKCLIYDLKKVNKVFEFYKKFKKYFSIPYDISHKTVVEYRTNPENKVYIHYISGNGSTDEEKYKVSLMTNVAGGVFTYAFVLFYGENIQYYITEENRGQTAVTESRNLKITEVDFSGDGTHYGMINDILVCREMKEEKTFEKMAEDYIIKRELINTVFEIKK